MASERGCESERERYRVTSKGLFDLRIRYKLSRFSRRELRFFLHLPTFFYLKKRAFQYNSEGFLSEREREGERERERERE